MAPAWSALDTFFTSFAVLPAFSVLGYWFATDGTVEHFGGKASATARTWCQVMASGDVLCSWLSYKAIRADGRMQRLAIEGVALYCAGHFGAFLWGHFYNVPMRPYLVVECCVGMPIPAAFWLWARMTGAFRVIKAD